MKKTFRILSCFVCVLFIAALVLTGCNFGIIPQSTTPTNNETEDNSPNESHGKQIPVYQGMSISTSLGVTMPSFEGQGSNGNGNGNGNGNTDNNGNHNGWYKGDSADNQGDVDQETPFPDADENIEQEIKDSLEVIGSKQDIYYANQNQNIYIHIYISNPDQFEILSFTLNGQKYSSYMFESGSTQELLILKLNVGDAHGIVDYTIDQIKYIDGTEIKDVKIGGDQTVKAGIRTEDQVTANVTDLQIGTNSISFNATVTDRDNLIAYNNGVIKAVLFNGEALVAEKELTLGANTVAFDNLTNGTVYQYAIVACYDNLTGDEIGFHILAKEALQTNNIVLFDNIVIGQDSINFTFKWDDSVSNKVLTGLNLYKNGELVTALGVDALTATQLLSANEYVLVAEYQDLGQPATISLTFATLEKGVPGIFITNTSATQTGIAFDIEESDIDSVGAITKIELVHKNGTVVAENVDVRSFENLLSNNTYMVKVTYTYDLNDGRGEQTIVKTMDITTEAKTAPRFTINNVEMTSTTFKADCEITDIDSVLVSYVVELYKGETLIAQSADGKIAFENLEDAEYTVKVSYTYDLNDGKGVQTSAYFQKIQTTFTLTESNRYMMGAIGDENGNLVIPAFFEYENVWYCVTSIGDYAFYYNDSLTSVTLPNSVTSIGDSAFSNCSNLTSFIIPESVTNIGNSAFSNSTGLKDVYFCSPTPPAMGHDVFGYVWNYDDFSIHVPEASYNLYTKINDGGYWQTWACPRIRKWNGWCFHTYEGEVTAPTKTTEGYTTKNCTVCGNSYKCNYVPEIGSEGLAYELNDNGGITITGIGSCTDTEIYIPTTIDGYTVTEIAQKAFAENSTIIYIKVSNTVNTIGARAFYKCTALQEIFIPESVYEIGAQIFQGCSNLTTVYYNGTYGSSENPFLCVPSINTVVFGGSYVPAYVAQNATNLTTVTILEGNTSIGHCAFMDCANLTNVTMANSITSIDSWAFRNCSALTGIVLPDNLSNISYGVFGSCSSLTSIVIPDGVSRIDDYAFDNCSGLVNVVIPDTVASIGSDAFAYCRALKTIVYNGTKEDWDALGDYWSSGTFFHLQCVDGVFCVKYHTLGYGSDCTLGGTCIVCGTEVAPTSHIFAFPYDPCLVCGQCSIHTWVLWDGEQSNLPTCTENGIEIAICSICSVLYNFEVDAYGHRYESVVTVPTKFDDGYTTYTCTVCGDTYKDDYVPAIGSECLAYELNENGGITITGIGTCTDTEIYIPAIIDGYTVTAIAENAFANCADVEGIIISKTVTDIGNRAFYKCTGITEIRIPSNVTNIGKQIFLGCEALATVYYDSSFAPVVGETFIKTESIKKIVFGDNLTHIPSNICYNCDNLEEIVFSQNTQYIGSYAFHHCTSVKQLNLPEGLISTGWYAFGEMNITELILPDSVTDVQNSFRDCAKLETIVLPVSIIAIPDQSFYCCYAIKEVYYKGDALDWSGISISDENFELENATIYFYSETQPADYGNYWHYVDGVPTLWHEHTEVIDEAVAPTCTKAGRTEGSHCSVCGMIFVGQESIPANGHNYEGDFCSVCGCDFSTEGLEFTLNDDGVSYSVTGIGTCADTELVIPAEHEGLPVTAIGKFAFSKCKTLTSVKIPDSVVEIQHYAFQQCILLTNVTIPNSVVTISYNVFEGCTSLANITLPDSVQTIGDNAFQNCTALTSFIVPNSVISIGRRAFDGCTSLSYNVYDNAYYLGSQDNPYYALFLATSTDITSCVTHADTKIICGGAFYECTNLTDVTIVDEVKGIGNYAFHGCSAIPTIVLPSNLKFMGNYVFQKCAALESIVIPEGIKKLNDYSFAGCESLASIVLPEGLTAIGGYVFRDCISLTSITIPQSVNSLAGYAFYNCSALTGIVIPAGVPFIGAYTFYGCASLYHVEIPESVTRIGNYAFRNCYALKELIFTGTIAQWKAIEFGKDWQVNVSVYTKVTCSDGTAPIR